MTILLISEHELETVNNEMLDNFTLNFYEKTEGDAVESIDGKT